MDYLLDLIYEMILIIFPFLVYIVFTTNSKNLEKKDNKLLFDLVLFSSFYFSTRYAALDDSSMMLLLINIPLLIAYIKQRTLAALIMSIIIGLIYFDSTQITLLIIILEYCFYFLVNTYLIKKKKNMYLMLTIFSLVKAFTFSFHYVLYIDPLSPFGDSIINLIILMCIFHTITGSIFYLLHKGEDIMDLNTTIKELEKEKMLRASLFKITHEIKNPIAVCKGYLDMLDINDEKKLHKYIPIVKQEISRTLTLMDDYLDYTKIKINKETVDLYLLIEETCDSLESLFHQNQIKTIFKIPDSELYMEIDYNRMKQVLVNIFKNAMEAKKDNEKMTISLTVKEENEEVIIKIKDNGVGMDQETLSKVSEMFYTTKQKGSGLGVSLSKEIIELHGGTMQYDSVKDKGTTVYITIPNKNQSHETLIEEVNNNNFVNSN